MRVLRRGLTLPVNRKSEAPHYGSSESEIACATPMTQSADPSESKTVVHDLAVLFVHGIGEHTQGDTLMQCGEPLVDWVNNWIAKGQPDRVRPAVSLSDGFLKPGPAEAARVTVNIPAGGDSPSAPTSWLLAESWWQEAFSPPGRRQVLSWMATFGPRTLARFARSINVIFQDLFRTGVDLVSFPLIPIGPMLIVFSVVCIGVTVFTMSVIIGALWVLILLVFLPLSVLPYGEAVSGRLTRIVSAIVGDTYMLTSHPFAMGAMVGQIHRDLDWLEGKAKTVAVIAHSQGTVVAREALRERRRSNVSLFVTYGSPLRVLTADLLDVQVDGQQVDEALDLGASAGIRWIDYYASMDPISAGRLWRQVPPPDDCQSIPVHNSASLTLDHASYWRNPDGFVAAVAANLAQAAGAPRERVAPNGEQVHLANRMREARVRTLNWTRRFAVLVAAAAVSTTDTLVVRETGVLLQRIISWLLHLLPDFMRPPSTWLDASSSWWLGSAGSLLLAAVAIRLTVGGLGNAWHKRALIGLCGRVIPETGRRWMVFFGPLGVLAIVSVLWMLRSHAGFDTAWLTVTAAALLAALWYLMKSLHETSMGRPRGLPRPTLRTDDLNPGVELAWDDRGVVSKVLVLEPKRKPTLPRFERRPFDFTMTMLGERVHDHAGVTRIRILEPKRTATALDLLGVFSGNFPELSEEVVVPTPDSFIARWDRYVAWKDATSRRT